jgi:hypothetical protein
VSEVQARGESAQAAATRSAEWRQVLVRMS